MFSVIAAVCQNQVIGDSQKKLWHLRPDLIHFKQLTQDHTVIFGRKTFELIKSPLRDRNLIILSNKNSVSPQDFISHQEIFVAGGGQIYKLFLPYCQKMYLTRIYQSFEGDIFFPKIGLDWHLSEKSSTFLDPKSKLNYHFETWHREP